MKKYLSLLALLAAPLLATQPTPGGSVASAIDSTGALRFLQVDGSSYLIPSTLATGFGFGSSPRVGGSVSIATDPSGNYQFLQVDSTGALIMTYAAPAGSIGSLQASGSGVTGWGVQRTWTTAQLLALTSPQSVSLQMASCTDCLTPRGTGGVAFYNGANWVLPDGTSITTDAATFAALQYGFGALSSGSKVNVTGGPVRNSSTFALLNDHAFEDYSIINISVADTVGGYCSYDSYPTLTANVNTGHYASYQSRLNYTGSGTIGLVNGYSASLYHNGPGNIGIYRGMNVDAPTVTGGGTIGYLEGIHIGAMTAGGTESRAIASDGGGVLFDGLYNTVQSGLCLSGPTYTNQTFYTSSTNADNRNWAWVQNGDAFGKFGLWLSAAKNGNPLSGPVVCMNFDKAGHVGFGGLLSPVQTVDVTGGVGSTTGFITTAIGGTISIKSGVNAKSGTFVLVAGAATVANTSVTANSVIIPTVKTVGGTRVGNPDIVPTASTGFVATGGVADTSTYNYVILEVN